MQRDFHGGLREVAGEGERDAKNHAKTDRRRRAGEV